MMMLRGAIWKSDISTAGSSAFGSGSGVGRFSTYVTVWPLVVRRNIVARTFFRTRSRVAQTKTGQRLGVGLATGVDPAAGTGHGSLRSDHFQVTTRLLTVMFETVTGVVVGLPGKSNWKRFSNGSTCSLAGGVPVPTLSLTTHWNCGVLVGPGVLVGAA